MVKLDDSKDLDDRALKELFGSLNAVTASDELKESTLDFIFAQEEGGALDKDDVQPERYPHLKVVESDAMASSEESACVEGQESKRSADVKEVRDNDVATSEGKEDVKQTAPTASGIDIGAKQRTARRRRKVGLPLKVAAAIVAFALIAGGGVAYATPANHVLVTVDDTTFDLGVNIFGSTVSAKANTNDGKAAIDAANVHNKGFGDACDQLLNAFEKRRGAKPDEVSLEVENRFGGGGDKIKEDVGNVIERHRESGNSNSSESSVSSIPQTEESTGGSAAPSQDSRPARDDNVSAESAPRNAEGDVGGNDAGPNNVGPNNADAMQPDANDTSALTAPSNDGPTGGQGGNMGEREPESGDRTQEPLAQGSPMQGRSGEGNMAPGQR